MSLNPFKLLPLYSQVVMTEYTKHVADDDQVAPHVFRVAANAYRALRTRRERQSVLISGESGAGKTEVVKVTLLS